jgi:hypothetical protein
MWEGSRASTQFDDFASWRLHFTFWHGPQNWKCRLIAGVAFQVGQVDEQIGLPLSLSFAKTS